MSDEKKLLGEERKKERQKQKALLLALKGKIVDNKLSAKDTADLLQVICLRLGITDKDRVIK